MPKKFIILSIVGMLIILAILIILSLIQIHKKIYHDSIILPNTVKGQPDLRFYLSTKNWEIDPSDYNKRIINQQLSSNEKLFCQALITHDKTQLLSNLTLNLFERQLFKLTQNDDHQCAIYLSAVKNNDQHIYGVHSISSVFLDGASFSSLTHCGLLKVAKLGDLNEEFIGTHLQPSSSCNTNDIPKPNRNNHPLNQAKTYRAFTNSSDVPLPVIIKTITNLKIGLHTLQKSYTKNLNFDASILNLNTKHKIRYTFGKTNGKSSMASLGKLFIIDNLLQNNSATSANDVRLLLCQSSTTAAQKLFAQTHTMANYIKQYQIDTQNNTTRTVFTTENQAIDTEHLENFLIHFYQTVKHSGQKLPHALDKGCTAGDIKFPNHYQLHFAKTGTAFSANRVTAKLLTIAYTDDAQTPYLILIRLHQPNGTGICQNSECFKNQSLQVIVDALIKTKF